MRLEQTRDERWWLVFGGIAGFSLNTKYLIAFYLVALAVGLLVDAPAQLTPAPVDLRGRFVGCADGTAQRHLAGRTWLALPRIGQGRCQWQEHGDVAPRILRSADLPDGPGADSRMDLRPMGRCRETQAGVSASIRNRLADTPAACSICRTAKRTICPPSIRPCWPFGPCAWKNGSDEQLPAAPCWQAYAILGALAAPLTLPILPIDTFVRYQQAVGLAPSAGEHQKLGVLPQYYADMFGWREMAEKVAAVYAALPPQDRARAVFYGDNYGEAAAIDVFGRRLGLPPAIGGHNSYYLWGPRGHDGSVMIIVGGNTKHYDEVFGSYTVAGHTQAPYAMPYENNQPIYVLRDLKAPLSTFWPTVKNYN